VRGERLRAAVCLYTNTPDLHFVIDAHPAHANVLLVSACSGHGFKFASAIGEAAAQWTLEGSPRLDLSIFSPNNSDPVLSAIHRRAASCAWIGDVRAQPPRHHSRTNANGVARRASNTAFFFG
jgi:hypothetical protein